MTKNTKHIRMPQAIAEAWLSDLRSNPKQGFRYLQDDKGGHCCLGRLQVVVDGDVERHEDGESYCLPSTDWLEKNGIEFFDSSGDSVTSPYCAKRMGPFTIVNDTKSSFPEIADFLEAEIEYND